MLHNLVLKKLVLAKINLSDVVAPEEAWNPVFSDQRSCQPQLLLRELMNNVRKVSTWQLGGQPAGISPVNISPTPSAMPLCPMITASIVVVRLQLHRKTRFQ